MTQILPKTIHEEIKKFITLQETLKMFFGRADREQRLLLEKALKPTAQNLVKIAEEPTINDHHQAIKDYLAVFEENWMGNEKTELESLKKAHDRLIEIANTPYAKDL